MSYRRWSKEEDIYLIDNFSDTTNSELSQKLGRTIDSVKMRAKVLDLEKSFSHRRKMGKTSYKRVREVLENL